METAQELTPELRLILNELNEGGRPERAAAAGLDFVFHNWVALLPEDEDVWGDPEIAVTNLMDVYDRYLSLLEELEPVVVRGLQIAAEEKKAAIPKELDGLLSELPKSQHLHHTAVADAIESIFKSWINELDKGREVAELSFDYQAMTKVIANTREAAEAALTNAAHEVAGNPSPSA